MAEPLSAVASVLTVITFGLTTCKKISDMFDSAKDCRADIRAFCSSNDTVKRLLNVLEGVLRQLGTTESAVIDAVYECIASCESALRVVNKELDKIVRLCRDPATLKANLFLRYAFQKETIKKLSSQLHQDVLNHLLGSSTIIAETVSYCSLRPEHRLAYFYFTFADPAKQLAENCLRALLRQLLLQSSTVPDGVRDVYQQYEHSCPPMTALKLALLSVLKDISPVYIIIDAMDECPAHSGERGKLLDLLQEMMASAAPNLHILLTSRKVQDIEQKIARLGSGHVLGILEEDMGGDIRSHVQTQLASDSTLSRWPQSTRQEIEDVLTSKANGMFRWVACQLDSLRKCMRPSTVKRTLETLPRTLDETYERILLQVDDEYQQEVRLALIWLVAAQRPLTVRELAEAVIVGISAESSFDPTDRLFDPNSIANVLTGLVTISGGFSSTIRLAHFSVEEYLVSDRLASSEASRYHVSIPSSHIALTNASLIYFRWANQFYEDEHGVSPLDKVGYWSRLYDYNTPKAPLIGYASKFWPAHLKSCESLLQEREIELVKELFLCQERMAVFEITTSRWTDEDADIGCRSAWESTQLPTEGETKDECLTRLRKTSRSSPLFHACRLGFLRLAKSIIQDLQGDQRNVSGGLGAQGVMDEPQVTGRFAEELRIACYYGHEELVELLVHKGADVEALGGRFGSALGACMYSQSPSTRIIQLLLENSKFVSDHSWTIGWVLRWAAMEGHLGIVRIISVGHEINGRTDYIWTTSYLSRLKNHGSNADRRKDGVNFASYPNRGTAPYEAAAAGHHDILSCLVKHWTNVNERDYEGRTGLYWAAFYGHTECVRLLLRRRASTSGHSRTIQWTPEFWAHDKGFWEIEQLLTGYTYPR
ncbi:MAG: hypothetical protein M1831_004163 [Alyxoria varia]|nr:MAG: hypothetical protein M1831_004163 [Alyxoria varia]